MAAETGPPAASRIRSPAGRSIFEGATRTQRIRASSRARAPDSTMRAAVHLECERGAEAYIRALLLQALSASGLAPTGLRARRERGEVASLRATVAVNGDVAQALEPVISRLSLEPGRQRPALAPGGGRHEAPGPGLTTRQWRVKDPTPPRVPGRLIGRRGDPNESGTPPANR
ncbi:hypothetical protein ACFVHI_00950 [Kitasatospora sp. NPDC127121]|uniref:hypothetical protein n=1 Tax=Kitasatospora sp. NPDC127121 TaxID=3345371 RepID=UPI003634B95B